MKKAQVTDGDIKIDAMRLLWSQGFVVRPEVVLSQPRSATKHRSGVVKDNAYLDLTDIDVLGYHFSGLMPMSSVAVDCGAGKSRSAMERVFWCKGLMESTGLSNVICVVGRETEEEHRSVALSLGILLMSSAQFGELLVATNDDSQSYPFDLYYRENLSWLKLVSETDAALSFYLMRDNWAREWERMPVQLPALLRRWQVNLDIKKPLHQFGLIELAILLSIGLVRMSSQLLVIRPEDLPTSVKGYVFGGSKRVKLIESLIKRADEYAAHLGSQPTLSEGANGSPLTVPHFAELLDLTHRLLAKPGAARMIPRYLQSFQIARLQSRMSNFESVLGHPADPLVTKMAIEVVRYLGSAAECRAQLASLFDEV